MTFTPVLIVLLIVDAALLVFAVRRPWLALLALLAGLPFNGLLLDVVAPALNIASAGSLNRLALAAWHDALSVGIILSAALAALGARRYRFGLVVTLAVAVFVWGVAALLLAPDLLTAAYAYRTLFGPPAVMVAIVVLASTRSMPAWVPTRAAIAIVASAAVAAVFAFWQVYIGGYGYLMAWFQVPSGFLPAAYSSSGLTQPRAIGTFHSPNEFGAYLVIAGLLTIAPAILPLHRWRPWVAALLGVALLLTFSRSAWVGAFIGTATLVFLTGGRFRLAAVGRSARSLAAPVLVFAIASGAVLATSNGAAFIYATVTGKEPSAAVRVDAIGDLFGGDGASSPEAIIDPRPSGDEEAPGDEQPSGEEGPSARRGERIAVTPLGGGLGTAGPKSTRFSGDEPVRHSEIWYLNYAAQVGLVGLALTFALVAAIVVELWRARRRPWPPAALGALLALGAGAIFIPVIDEPAVAGPLWAVVGIALATARARTADPDPARVA